MNTHSRDTCAAVQEFRFENREECLLACAKRIAAVLAVAISERGRAIFATAAGNTAEQLLPLLVHQSLNWASATVVLADERWVSRSDQASNERFVAHHLMNSPAAAAQLVGLKTSHENAQEGLDACEKRLAFLKDLPIDVVFLSMAEDGHVASLFPNGEWANCLSQSACIATKAPVEPVQRMSLTPERLLSSRLLILPIMGHQKQKIYSEARLAGRAEDYPVRLVLHQSATPVEVFLTD